MSQRKIVTIVLLITIVGLILTAVFLAIQINKNNAPANSSANSPISQDDAIAFCKARVPKDPIYNYVYSGIGGGGCGPSGSCSAVQISLDCVYVDEAQSKVLRQNYCINATACGYAISSSSSSAPSGQIQCGLCGYTMTTQSQCDNIRNWSNANACSCASKYDLRTEAYDPSKNVNCTSGGGSSSSTSTGGGTLQYNKLCGQPCGIRAGGLCTAGSICRYVVGPACTTSEGNTTVDTTYCVPINLPSGWSQANCVSRDQGNLYVLNNGLNPTIAQLQSICQTTPTVTPLPNTGIEDGLGYLILGLIFILFGGSFYLEFLNKKKVINS